MPETGGVRVKLSELQGYPDIENYFSDSAMSEISNNFTLTPEFTQGLNYYAGTGY